MGPGLVALFAALGVSGWAYSKLQQRTGYGNNQSAVIGTTVIGIITFVIVFTVGQILLHSSN